MSTQADTTDDEVLFAYNDYRVRNNSDCVGCPAVEADVIDLMAPEESAVVHVAELYDEIADESEEWRPGTVTEEEAQEAWFEAIEQAKDEGVPQRAIDEAHYVTEELGWNDE